MNFRRIILLILLVLSTPSAGVLGQVSRQDLLEEKVLPAVADPSLSSAVTNGAPQVTLTSGKDGSSLVGEIGLSVPGDWIWSLRLQAPVENGQEEVELASLEGLGAGAAATMGLTKVFFQVTDPGAILGICDQFNSTLTPKEPIDIPAGECSLDNLRNHRDQNRQEIANRVERQTNAAFCMELNKIGQSKQFLLQKDTQFQGNPPKGFEDCDSFIAKLRASAGDSDRKLVVKLDEKLGENLVTACQENNQTPTEGFIDTSVRCQLDDLPVSQGGVKWRQRALDAVGISAPKFLSLKVSASNKVFKVAKEETIDNTPTLTEDKISKENYSGTASFGVLYRGFYYGANAIFERLYKGSPVTQICRPIPGKPGEACSNLALQGPTPANQDLFQAELRKFFSPHLGINLKASYERREAIKGYQFLLYFLRNEDKEKGGLNGGLDFGYRSDTNDFTIRAFIGTALKIVPISAF